MKILKNKLNKAKSVIKSMVPPERDLLLKRIRIQISTHEGLLGYDKSLDNYLKDRITKCKEIKALADKGEISLAKDMLYSFLGAGKSWTYIHEMIKIVKQREKVEQKLKQEKERVDGGFAKLKDIDRRKKADKKFYKDNEILALKQRMSKAKN